MKIETTASGKVFLSGEYMALEGGRAITLSTPQSAKVSISEINESNNLFLSSMSDQAYPFRIDENMSLIWLDEDPKHLGSILRESIKQFDKDILHWKNYDYVVINDQLKICYDKIINILNAELENKKSDYDKKYIEDHIKKLI